MDLREKEEKKKLLEILRPWAVGLVTRINT
jgi:hypothetical protein